MALNNGFRVICDSSNIYSDYRSRFIIYVDPSKDHVVGDLSARIKTVLGLQSNANILLLINDCLLPDTENIQILHQEDIIRVVNHNKKLLPIDEDADESNVEPTKEKKDRGKRKRKRESDKTTKCLQIAVNQSVTEDVTIRGVGDCYIPEAADESNVERTKEKKEKRKRKRKRESDKITESLQIAVNQSVTEDTTSRGVGDYYTPEPIDSVHSKGKRHKHVKENFLDQSKEKCRKKKKHLAIVDCLQNGREIEDQNETEDAVSKGIEEEDNLEQAKEKSTKKKKKLLDYETVECSDVKNKVITDQNVRQVAANMEKGSFYLVANSKQNGLLHVHQSDIAKDNNKMGLYSPSTIVNDRDDSTHLINQCLNKQDINNGIDFCPTSLTSIQDGSQLSLKQCGFERETINGQVCISSVPIDDYVKPTAIDTDNDECTQNELTPMKRKRKRTRTRRRKHKNSVNNLPDNIVAGEKSGTSKLSQPCVSDVKTEGSVYFSYNKAEATLNDIKTTKHIKFSGNSECESETVNSGMKIQGNIRCVPEVSPAKPSASKSRNTAEQPVGTKWDIKRLDVIPAAIDNPLKDNHSKQDIFSKLLALAHCQTPLVVTHSFSPYKAQENDPVISDPLVIEPNANTSSNSALPTYPLSTQCDTRNSTTNSMSSGNTNFVKTNSSNQQNTFDKLLALANYPTSLVAKHTKPSTPEPEENALPSTTVPLNGLPNPGDIVTFKIFRLDENYCPEVSKPITAEVIEYLNTSKEIHFSILAGADQCLKPRGKFELEMDVDNELEQELPSVMVFKLTELLEPQWHVK